MMDRSGFRASVSWIAAACWLTLASSGGCSVLFRLSPEQCSTDHDCTDRGAAFAGYVCRQGTCVASNTTSPPEDAAVGSSRTDASLDASQSSDTSLGATPVGPDADASIRTDSSLVAPDAGGAANADAEMAEATTQPEAAPCTSSADCVALDPTRPQVACEAATGACVQLTTADCPLVIGDYSGRLAPPLFIGAFATLPDGALQSHPGYLNYAMAINEFTNAGGISGWDPRAHAPGLRMPVAVVCNSVGDVQKAMSHLVGTLHVPTVVAALDSKTLRTTFVRDAYPNNVFVVNVFGADSTLMSLTTDGLLWHMLGQPRDNAPAYAAFLPRVEAYVRAKQNLTGSVRLAVITGNATVTNDLENAALAAMQWNGASTDTNERNGLFRKFALDSVLSSVPITSIDVSTVGNALLDFNPHIVVSFASSEFIRLIQYLELKWKSPNRPFYFIGPYNMESQDLLAWATEERRTRIAGITFASATYRQALDSYTSRFLGVYVNAASSLGRENYYDAMYFAIYSIVGAGKLSTLRGTDLAQGMLRLLSGTQYQVGPAYMGDISGALGTSNGTVTLMGTLGAPNFVRATGARVGEGSVYCISRDDGKNAFLFDVLRLASSEDGGSPALSGRFSCYDGL